MTAEPTLDDLARAAIPTRLDATLFVEAGAGAGIGLADQAYRDVGAEISPDADAVFAAGELIVKVKEPQAVEIARLTPGHILFTYLHLAADPAQARGLMASGCTAIAYETISDRRGRLPLLAPMSQVAGCMAALVGAQYMLKPFGGRGLLDCYFYPAAQADVDVCPGP